MSTPSTAILTMEQINTKTAIEVPLMDMVKDKYIQNYNVCNGGSNGEFMYQRNLVFIQHLLNSTEAYRKCTPFSVYECLTTVAAFGYSCDPADDHVYFVPRGGRLCISKQAGAKLLRLYKTKQIVYNSEATLVYEDDIFTKKNGLIEHEECYKSDKIIGGYVKFTLDERGTQRHISYKMSDIEVWKSKSDQKTGSNWEFGPFKQPAPGFLRTKIMAHACTEKCWIPGNTPQVEIPVNIFIEDIEDADAPAQINSSSSAPTQQDTKPIGKHIDITPKPAAQSPTPSFIRKSDPPASNSATPF